MNYSDAIRTGRIEIHGALSVQRVVSFRRTSIEIAGAHADVADDHIGSTVHLERVTPQCNSSRRRLPGDRQLAPTNGQRSMQLNAAADIEHNRAGPVGGTNCVAQTACNRSFTLLG